MYRKINRRNGGFLLLELCIVLVVIGMVMVGGHALVQILSAHQEKKNTSIKQTRIMDLLCAHFSHKGALPKPEDYASYAVQESTSFYKGYVPYQELGLRVQDVQDAYGNRIIYVVQANLCNALPTVNHTCYDMFGAGKSPFIIKSKTDKGDKYNINEALSKPIVLPRNKKGPETGFKNCEKIYDGVAIILISINTPRTSRTKNIEKSYVFDIFSPSETNQRITWCTRMEIAAKAQMPCFNFFFDTENRYSSFSKNDYFKK